MNSEENSRFANDSGNGNNSVNSSSNGTSSASAFDHFANNSKFGFTSALDYYDIADNVNRAASESIPAFKRWNSLPMGINFSNCRGYPESSSSSEEEDEDQEEDTAVLNSSDIYPALASMERKSASLCYDRRPSSASGAVYAIRHRSNSSALYLRSGPFRLLDKGIEKLKREANVRSCIETDYAGEKMSVAGAAIMYSMDEFNIASDSSTDSAAGNSEQRRRTQSLTEPVHVLTNLLPASCSPSPTRIEKQCYSPSMQQVVRTIAMSPTSSPSPPTRRQCIRSLSPIALRFGMGLKRKCDSNGDGCASTTAKRAHYALPTTPPAATVETARTPLLYPLASKSFNHSFSESSIDSECSNSTISSDFNNISTSHSIYRPLSNTTATSSGSCGYPSSNAIEDTPIIEETIIDDG